MSGPVKKTIGIIGGMGPLATVDLFEKIIRLTDAQTDQQHIPILIDNNTQIPDRTEAILRAGQDPTAQLVTSARKLEAMGADLLAIACNTAHHFLPQVQSAVDIPVLDMVSLLAKELLQRGISCCGLLATDGVLQSELYSRTLDRFGIKTCLPSPKNQQALMDYIYYSIKAGDFHRNRDEFVGVLRSLLDSDAQILVLACTELPLAFSCFHLDFPAVDPTAILAKQLVLQAGYRLIQT